MNDKKKEQKMVQARDKEIQKKKIEEMEQDEEAVCTISKDSNNVVIIRL